MPLHHTNPQNSLAFAIQARERAQKVLANRSPDRRSPRRGVGRQKSLAGREQEEFDGLMNTHKERKTAMEVIPQIPAHLKKNHFFVFCVFLALIVIISTAPGGNDNDKTSSAANNLRASEKTMDATTPFDSPFSYPDEEVEETEETETNDNEDTISLNHPDDEESEEEVDDEEIEIDGEIDWGVDESEDEYEDEDIDDEEINLEENEDDEDEEIDCTDDPDYQSRHAVQKTCEWVAARHTASRCANPDNLQHCRATCDPACQRESDETQETVGNDEAIWCFDEPDFLLEGDKRHSCAWVAERLTSQRCPMPEVADHCRATCHEDCTGDSADVLPTESAETVSRESVETASTEKSEEELIPL